LAIFYGRKILKSKIKSNLNICTRTICDFHNSLMPALWNSGWPLGAGDREERASCRKFLSDPELIKGHSFLFFKNAHIL
jgi:hypothetical protein